MVLTSLIDLLRIDTSQDGKFIKILKDVASSYEDTAVIQTKKIKQDDLSGIKIEFDWDGYPEWSRMIKGVEIKEKMIEAGRSLEMNSGLELAMKTIDTIIEAEAKVHSIDPSEVKFYELSSPRLIVNLIGVGYIIENYIDSSWLFCSTPISIGMGKVKISHGEFKIPPPVTEEILQKFEYKPSVHYNKGPISGELATPTGIALLCNLVKYYFPASPIPVDKFGIGFGSKLFQSKQSYLKVLQS